MIARLVSALGLVLLFAPPPAYAGMPMLLVSEIASLRLEAISFFALVFAAVSFAVHRLWNLLRGDFPAMPELSFRRALALVFLSLLGMFVLVFASVMATAGIVHQSVWLVRGPIFTTEGPVHRGKQKRTMSDLRSIGTAVEAYRVEHGGLPEVGDGTVATLAPVLAPTFIKRLPVDDAWHVPIHWRHWPGADSYSVISLGRDLRADEVVLPGPTTQYAADIYICDGQFTVYPEGTQN